MATFAIGTIGNFDDGIETWEAYAERLQQYFIANGIANEINVPALLSLIGPKTCALLKPLVAPDKPSDKTFEVLIDHLNKHLNSKPLVIAERFRFHERDQKQGETTMQYIAELRNLAIHYNFGDNLGDTRLDRFVCGLRHENIQKNLLSKDDLTLDLAVKTAVAMETASNDAIELQ
jgi:hypothetical protein